MALRQSYEVQTEIPSSLQEHYTERDGKWWITLDPVLEDVTGLKNALTQERNLRRDAEKTVTDLKVRFEGIDPDEVARLRDRVKGLDESEIYDRQGIEALVSKRTESMKADHERVTRQKDVEIGKLKDALTTTEHKRKTEKIRTELLNAVTASGVHADALDDAVSRGLSVFNEVDDQGNVIAKQGDDLRYGKDGVNPLSPSEWITTLKAEGRARHLWPSSSGGGAPAHHSGNGAGIDWNSITNPAERLTRFREWQATQQR
jgi:hypothetical protein